MIFKAKSERNSCENIEQESKQASVNIVTERRFAYRLPWATSHINSDPDSSCRDIFRDEIALLNSNKNHEEKPIRT